MDSGLHVMNFAEFSGFCLNFVNITPKHPWNFAGVAGNPRQLPKVSVCSLCCKHLRIWTIRNWISADILSQYKYVQLEKSVAYVEIDLPLPRVNNLVSNSPGLPEAADVRAQARRMRARGPPNQSGFSTAAAAQAERSCVRGKNAHSARAQFQNVSRQSHLLKADTFSKFAQKLDEIRQTSATIWPTFRQNLATSRYDFANSGKISASFDKKLRFES